MTHDEILEECEERAELAGWQHIQRSPVLNKCIRIAEDTLEGIARRDV